MASRRQLSFAWPFPWPSMGGRAGILALSAATFFAPILSEPTGARAAETEQSDSPLVTFAGLRVYDDGRSTLVVDLTRPAAIKVEQQGKEVIFLLSGAKVKWRNNKNPLLAQYFNSNVLSAKLDDTKAGARFTVTLRESVRPQHNMVSAGTGARLRIDVPAPSAK